MDQQIEGLRKELRAAQNTDLAYTNVRRGGREEGRGEGGKEDGRMGEDERERPGEAKAGVCPVPLHVNYMHMYRNNMINKQSTDITSNLQI